MCNESPYDFWEKHGKVDARATPLLSLANGHAAPARAATQS
jgi:hypothetical protein